MLSIGDSSISGAYSGAFMAGQFATAWSATIKGVGIMSARARQVVVGRQNVAFDDVQELLDRHMLSKPPIPVGDGP